LTCWTAIHWLTFVPDYAFYSPNFSFKEVITRHPEAADQITDCLSGDVNKDFSQLWSWVGEFVSLPAELPYGQPLIEQDTTTVLDGPNSSL
jgi:hypothetical protein